MPNSSRFVIAVHILTLLAYKSEKLLSSDWIAGSVNTNPVVIRRMLGTLAGAGFVTTKAGSNGGTKLKVNPENINLLSILKAVENDGIFALHSQVPNPNCLVGNNIQQTLSSTLTKAESAMENVLREMTIAQLLEQLISLSNHHS